MIYLITGSNGLLGSYLSKKLNGNIYHVDFRNKSKSSTFLCNCVSNFFELDELIKLDNRFIILHCATKYHNSVSRDIFDTNLYFGINLIKFLSKFSDKHFYFFNISTPLPSLYSEYSFSKYVFSRVLKEFSTLYNCFSFLNIILFNFYSGLPTSLKFPDNLINAVIRNEESFSLSRGIQMRDFIFIYDVIDALEFLINNISIFENKFYDIELGTSLPISIFDFANSIRIFFNSSIIFKFGSLQSNIYEPPILTSNNKFLNELGWEPKFTLHTSLEHIQSKYSL